MPEAALAPAAPAARTAFGATVAGLGTALPERVVATEAIAARLDVTPDWIVSRTGIRERRYAAPGQRLSDLAAEAARAALDDAGVEAAALDLVLVATFTADEHTPAAAPLVAHAVGATRAGAIDVDAACTGFLSALALAAAHVESGRAAAVLVVGADFASRLTDPGDRRTASLFGDGAGAAVLTRTGAPGAIGPAVLGADGAQPELLCAPRATGLIEMDGPEVFRHAVARMSEAAAGAAAAAGSALEEIDLFVFHQANARILRSVAARLDLDPGRVVDCISRYGNTSAASIPIALAEAETSGALRPGDRVLLAAFGAGFTWGGVVVDWRAA